MGIGTSVFLFVVGAILAFAVHVPVDGVNVHALGFILMLVGLLGGILSLLFWNSRGGWGSGWGGPRGPAYRRERMVVDPGLRAAPMVVRDVPAAPVVVAQPQPVVAGVPVAGRAVPVAGGAVPVAPVVSQPVAGGPVRVRRTTVYEDRI